MAEGAKESFADLARRLGKEFNLPPSLLMAIAQKESSLNPKAVSPPNTNGTRDYGLMQINQSNLEHLGLDFSTVLDPEKNMRAACMLLAEIRNTLIARRGRAEEQPIISSYNQGIGNYLRYGIRNVTYVLQVTYWKLIYSLRGL